LRVCYIAVSRMSIESCVFGAAPQRTLVLFPGALGDFICFLPSLGKLAQRRAVDLFARSDYGDIAPASVRTRSLECDRIARLFVPGADQDADLAQFFGAYAEVYSWMASGEPTFVANLSRLTHGRVRAFPFRPHDWRCPMMHYYLCCLGEDARGVSFGHVLLGGEALRRSSRYWESHALGGQRILAIAPGSGAGEKNWPAAYFDDVARWWERQAGGRVLVILGPAEAERAEPMHLGADALVVREERLGTVAALLSRCDIYLGNDSGLSHLAAALGVPTVTLFGPTDPTEWAPQGRHVIVLSQRIPCSPCSEPIRLNCTHRVCLSVLTPGVVIETLDGLVNGVFSARCSHS
jgi:hypothetical protein